jgi:hypothetical protein
MKPPKGKKRQPPPPPGGRAMGRLRQFQLERGLDVDDVKESQADEKSGKASDPCKEDHPQESEGSG